MQVTGHPSFPREVVIKRGMGDRERKDYDMVGKRRVGGATGAGWTNRQMVWKALQRKRVTTVRKEKQERTGKVFESFQ